MIKQVIVWIGMISFALSISVYVSYHLRAIHQLDCSHHKILLAQAEREFANGYGLSGQTFPELEYLTDHCSDINMGTIS
jgi:hypothetical protein